MKVNTLMACLALLSFIIGLVIFAITHSNFYEEIDEVLITGLNFSGENYSLFNSSLLFLLPGILAILITLSSIKNSIKKIENRIAQTLLLITGIYWLSFGVLTVDPFNEVSWSSFNIRSMIYLLVLVFTMFFLTLASISLTKIKFSLWITGGYLVILLSVFSALLMESHFTFHMINVSYFLFFIWLIYFGWTVDLSKTKSTLDIKKPEG